MTTQELKNQIADMCEQAGCSEKTKKIHYEQYVYKKWHPHPPQSFQTWWSQHQDHVLHEIDAKRAYNCQHYRDEFMEAKQYGAA